jgi:hypothetical protein
VSGDKRTPGGLSAKTLLIAAVASAAAALVIPMLWRPGTVFAAAMTPVVVALVSEMLRRPVETVSSVRVRRTPRGTAILDPLEPETEEFDPLAPPSAEELLVLPERHEAPRAEHHRAPLTSRQWKLALATGLAAFTLVAGVVTASDLVTGDAVSGGGRTTFFGGGSSKSENEQGDTNKRQESKSKQDEQPAASATPTATATPEPEATTTPEPTVTAAPTATITPAPASPAPTP